MLPFPHQLPAGGTLGLAVSLGVPPPHHNVIFGFLLSHAAVPPGAITLPHLLLSHLCF